MSATPIAAPFSVREAAAILQMDERTVRRHIHSGAIDAVRIGRTFRIPAAEMAKLAGDLPVGVAS